MSKRRIARHRAETPKTNSVAVIAKAIGENTGGMGRQAAVVAAASGLVLSGGVAAHASVTGVSSQEGNVSEAKGGKTFAAVTTLPGVSISFEAPVVVSKPAPKPDVAVKPIVKAQNSTKTQNSNFAATPGVPARDARGGGIAAGIVAAAYAQLGQTQDCTALVRRALSAMGLPTTPMGPEHFRTLGRVLGPGESPKPGDIAFYSNNDFGGKHVAIYVGNGQAIHGGWNGSQTVLRSVNISTGAPNYFISVTNN